MNHLELLPSVNYSMEKVKLLLNSRRMNKPMLLLKVPTNRLLMVHKFGLNSQDKPLEVTNQVLKMVG